MALWRTEDPLIDEHGKLVKGGMLPHQRAWWELPNFVRLLVAGYGSGKTMILCKRMIALALENAPAPVAIVSPTYPMAKETVISTTSALLEGKRTLLQGFSHREWKTAPYQFRIHHHGRTGRILVYSGEHPERLKGPNLAAVGIDEPFIQARAVFDQVLARIRHPQAKRRELNLSGTPEKLNWGYEIAEGELGKSLDVGVVRASTRDNPVLPREYVERLLRSLSERERAAYIEGQFVDMTKGRAYYAFERAAHVVDTLPYDRAGELLFCFDFNVSPGVAAIVQECIRDGRKVSYVLGEVWIPDNSNTPAVCSRLLQDWGAHVGTVLAYGDATGGSRSTNATRGSDWDIIRDMLGRHFGERLSMRVRNANPPERARVNAVNARLRNSLGEVSMLIARAAKHVALDFDRVSLLEGGSGEIDKRHDKSLTHLSDAIGYYVHARYPLQRRIDDVVSMV